MSLYNIRPGDRVTIRTARDQEITGRASPLLCFASHVVLNIGGKHGTPAVATAHNIVRIARKGAA